MGLKVHGWLDGAASGKMKKAWHLPVTTLIFMVGNDLLVSIFLVASIFFKLAGQCQLQILDKLRGKIQGYKGFLATSRKWALLLVTRQAGGANSMVILAVLHRSPVETIASHAGELRCHISLASMYNVFFTCVRLCFMVRHEFLLDTLDA